MSYLALFLLGTPRIERDGVPLQVNLRKALALLAYTAVTGERHSRSALATLLWSEHDLTRARAALATTLSVLNKTLGKGWLDIDRKGVGLGQRASLWVDVNHFRGLLAECRTHGHASEKTCPACFVPLSEAAELYRGNFMADFAVRDDTEFDVWQRFQVKSLHREMVSTLEKLVLGHSAQGEYDRAIVYALRWVILAPCHESAHRHLMQLYAWTGQRAAALRQYEECAHVLKEKLGLLPQEATTRLHHSIEQDRLPSPPATLRFWTLPLNSHNLPPQPTPFVGREEELADIARLLGDPACRLLSLVGPGGIGKTRLAIQAAAENARMFPHGVCFVPLASLNSPDLLAPTIADALDFSSHEGTDPAIQLLNYLRDREKLLVLDNFEYLLDGTGLLTTILSTAPGVKMLITSRERLNLQWEWSLEIRGLSFPESDGAAAVEDYSAVRLFLQSTRRVKPNFVLSEEEKPAVVRICQSLEGMPLGIELAAAWGQSLSCRQIAHEIERHLDFLTTPMHDVPERHRSLRSVFDHSWNLLLEEERSVVSKLSVFRGGFRAEAAERVTGAFLPLLSALVRKSFVHRNRAGRYDMLEVLRQYAEEKLHRISQERDETHDRHCEYYAEFLHRREAYLKEERRTEVLQEIGAEIENVRAAWQWAITHGKEDAIGKALTSLYSFYDLQSWFKEGEEAFSKAAEALGGVDGVIDGPGSEKAVAFARALARQGHFCLKLSLYATAKDVLQRSLCIFHRLGARRETAFCLNDLGNIAYEFGDYSKARRLYQESLVLYKEIGDRWGIAGRLNNLGNVSSRLKEYAKARQLYRESLVISKQVGNRRGAARCLTNLGLIAELLDEYAEAEQLHQASIAAFKEIGDQWQAANGLNNLGFAFCALGEYQRAKKCFHQALETAMDTHSVHLALEALVGIATLLVKEGEKEQALELVAYTLDHPALCREVRHRAEHLLSGLEFQFSPWRLEMIKEIGRVQNFRNVLRGLEWRYKYNLPGNAFDRVLYIQNRA